MQAHIQLSTNIKVNFWAQFQNPPKFEMEKAAKEATNIEESLSQELSLALSSQELDDGSDDEEWTPPPKKYRDSIDSFESDDTSNDPDWEL